MKKGIVVGKSEYSYKKDDKEMMSRTLHVLWDKPTQLQDGFQGQEAENVFCRFDISGIAVGDHCDFLYEIKQFGGRTSASLTGIQVIGKAKLDIKVEPVKAG